MSLSLKRGSRQHQSISSRDDSPAAFSILRMQGTMGKGGGEGRAMGCRGERAKSLSITKKGEQRESREKEQRCNRRTDPSAGGSPSRALLVVAARPPFLLLPSLSFSYSSPTLQDDCDSD